MYRNWRYEDEEEPLPEVFCDGCEQEVTPVLADHGIGAYEYWGARGVHHDYRPTCPICGNEVSE